MFRGSGLSIGVGTSTFFGGGRIFAQILPNLPNKTPKEKSFSCYFGRHFCSYFQEVAHVFRVFVKVFRDFAQISTDFARILRDFTRIFTESKLLGCACTPCLLHQ